MDKAWWDKYINEAQRSFTGELASFVPRRQHPLSVYPVKPYSNSGAGAISLAIALGAERVILLGYDCGYINGKRHWHGDHPRELGNAGTVAKWPDQFRRLRNENPDIDIINCTRRTALDVFPCAPLEEVLL